MTNLVKCLNQDILAARLERNAEVGRGTSGWESQALRDGFPSVNDSQVIPTWCEGCRKAAEENGDEDEEHRELIVAHDYWRLLNAVYDRTRSVR